MKKSALFIGKKRLSLDKRIGKGGEGEVYLFNSAPDRAIKIYSKSDGDREAKVKEMVRLGLARVSSLISYPEEIVTDSAGAFVGFTMRLVKGHRPIHELYGVKSRKHNFPKADFRFLVRSAANTARAVAQVHNSPCVIGDINHSGILVSEDATVALIDADSFQLQENGTIFPCLVGVPDFTPPELHGTSLRGLVRTQIHDRFGLAVAIFQLLLMGRHPYAGRQKGGDLPLDQLIAKNYFAYSRIRKLEVAPPPGAVTLNDFPDEIADAFERAFGVDPSKRPSAIEWVDLLEHLEKRLSRCGVNSVHYYPSTAKKCPWCEVEAASGVILFISSYIPPAQIPPNGNVDIEKIWSTIRSITFPTVETATPKLPALPSAPSMLAKSAARKRRLIKGASMSVGGLICGLWVAFPAFAIGWIVILIVIYQLYNRNVLSVTEWQAKYREAETKWSDGLDSWRTSLRLSRFHELKGYIEKTVEECRGLPNAESLALNRLKTDRRERQLQDHLDRFLIRDATIPGIGSARKVTLASFGIETAADVSMSAITNISGFGQAMAAKLMAWRASHERSFVYNAVPGPADAQAESKVKAEFAAKLSALRKKIADSHAELIQISNSINQKLTVESPNMSRIAVIRSQLKTDLEYLGIPIPLAPTPTHSFQSQPSFQSSSNSGAPQRSPTSIHAPRAQVTCPRCGSPMVQRRARRGRRSGSVFWGCSRFPSCRGTRN